MGQDIRGGQIKRGYLNISVHSVHEHTHYNTVLANNADYYNATTQNFKCPEEYLFSSVLKIMS